MPGQVPGIDAFVARHIAAVKFDAEAFAALDAGMATFDSSFEASAGVDSGGGDGGGGGGD